ncbi:MAG: glycosyltransferase family 9 protein, partial [Candidatus Rokuibacteriota bacterium]
LLAGQGLGDVLVTYPRSLTGRIKAADSVRALGAGVALLLPNSLESGLSAWYWGTRRRIGFAGGGRTRLLTDRLTPPSPRRHQVDEYLLLLEPLGLPPVTRAPALAAPTEGSESREAARALFNDAGADNGRGPRVGLHLGAEFGPSKLWPIERLTQFCRLLVDRGARPVLLGTAADLPAAAGVRELVAVPSLVGRDTPALLPAVLAELDGLVCGDTGVGHLAAALGTAVVSLFGPTDPHLTAPRGRVKVVSRPTPCAPCFYRACPIDHPCLRAITADEVEARLRTLLPQWA